MLIPAPTFTTHRFLSCIALVFFGASLCDGADKPAGVVTSAGSFKVDGAAVTNSATVFEGSKVECATAGCSFKRTGSGAIDMDPNSGLILSHLGIKITSGQIRMSDGSDLTVPSAEAIVRPSSPQSVIRARFIDGELTVDLLKGSAQLFLKSDEAYARLDTGTRMRFPADSGQPLGVDLLVTGCTHYKDGHWYVKDEHIKRDVEVRGENAGKERRKVEIRGAMQVLPAQSDSVAAVVSVLSEKRLEGACVAAFLPVVEILLTGTTGIPILLSNSNPRVSVP
jgi:hypothetical protein